MPIHDILALVLTPLLIAAAIVVLRRFHADASCQRAADSQRLETLLNEFGKLQSCVEAAEARRQQQDHEELQAALAGVIADFDRKLLMRFDAQLHALAALARNSEELLRKQREEQMEAMHHARRIADKMDGSTELFGLLMNENSELLALAGQVRESLALLGQRQDAIDGDIVRQAQAVDAMAAAMRELKSGFDAATEQLLLQSRRALDAMAQRQSQGNNALQKDVNESLARALAGMTRQLSSIAPISHLAKRP